MKLARVEISNYRSIKVADIPVSDDFTVLLGENESGKSNILKAISLLSKVSGKALDVRVPYANEQSNSNSQVNFFLDLQPDDFDYVYECIKSNVFDNGDVLCAFNNVKYRLKDFINYFFKQCVYVIDVYSDTRRMNIFETFDDGIIVSNNLHKVKDPILLSSRKVGDRVFGAAAYVVSESVAGFSDLLERCSIKEFYNFIFNKFAECVSVLLPKVVVWSYAESDLFPSVVNMDSFFASPDSYPALKNVFVMAGYRANDEIIEAYNVSRGSRARLLSFFKNVSDGATRRLNEVWPDRCVAFEMSPDGGNVLCAIKDKFNIFDLEVRSDGFKRCMFFVLSIAALEETSGGRILVIDEPDVGLHPAAIRMLKKELINLSNRYQIFVSTHSVHMVDPDNINRHLIVSKNNEATSIALPAEGDFYQEEVLYSALTDSIFSVLKRRNYIFEGWFDRKMFSIAAERFVGNVDFIPDFMNVGVCFAGGCSNVKRIVPIFEAAQRECVIISDADKPAKKNQEEFLKMKLYGSWVRYDELLGDLRYITAEDFIKDDDFLNISHEFFNLKKVNVDIDKDLVASGDRIEKIKNKVSVVLKNNDSVKIMMNEFKTHVFDNLKNAMIDDKYYEALKQSYRLFAQ